MKKAKSNKALSAYTQECGLPAFTPERPKTADLGEKYAGKGKPHDARTIHIKQGDAQHPTIPTKCSR